MRDFGSLAVGTCCQCLVGLVGLVVRPAVGVCWWGLLLGGIRALGGVGSLWGEVDAGEYTIANWTKGMLCVSAVYHV